MTYRKWLMLFLTLTLIPLLLLYGLRYAGHRYVYDLERAVWVAKAEMIDNLEQYNVDYLIVGTSRTLALDPVYLREQHGITSLNLSVGGATAPSTYYLVERILNKQDVKPKKIFIELNPNNLSAFDTDVHATMGERFIRFVATRSEARDMAQYAPDALKKYNDIWRFPYSGYFNKTDATLLHGYKKRKDDGMNDADMIQLMKDNGGFFLFGKDTYNFREITHGIHRQQAIEYARFVDRNTRQIPELSRIYFEKLVATLEAHQVDYHFFFSPMPMGRAMIGDLSFGKTRELFGMVETSKITNSVLLLEEKLFSDPSHLNFEGSRVFNDYFYDCIVNPENGCGYEGYQNDF